MEKELKAAKRFNKVAIVVFLFMLVMLASMLVHMQHLADNYECLERNYEKLYEEMKGE